ncbi:MAG: hypothetical protein K2Y32_12565 [Candidatus Obscuribacterales bacterium]|nr:hypothetical protein [Candidatus Obscuribacterales bacterium]
MTSVENSVHERLKNLMTLEYEVYRGQLLNSFNKRFPTDESCWLTIIHDMREQGTLRCKKCGSPEVEVSIEHRTQSCKDCKKVSFFTAGTFFHRVRKIRAWMFAIYILDKGFFVSSKWLGYSIGVSQSSSLHIIKSALLVFEQNESIEDGLKVKLIQFKRFFSKRSILTNALVKPIDEMNALDEGKEDNSEERDKGRRPKKKSKPFFDSETAIAAYRNDDKTEELAERVLQELSKGLRSFDELVKLTKEPSQRVLTVLTDLEFSFKIRAVAGGRFERLKSSLVKTNSEDKPLEKWLEENSNSSEKEGGEEDSIDAFDSIAVFCTVARKVARGISRKYIGLFVALSNEIILGHSLGEFFSSCIGAGYFGSRFIRNYQAEKEQEFVKSASYLKAFLVA